MSRYCLFYIITHKTEDNLLIGYEWEITATAAIIKSRVLMESKNNCFRSLEHHALKYLKIKVDRFKVIGILEKNGRRSVL